jgi:small GTP-binding protein
MLSEPDLTHKVVMLGCSGVGKTSLVLQLREKVFKRMVTPTVGSGVILKEIMTKNGPVPLKIWDTAGEERYRFFAGLYSQGAVAGIVVFDLADENSFGDLDEWIKIFRETAAEDAILVVVGNKSDLGDQRQVKSERGRAYAESRNMAYYEVSAKTGENVDVLFGAIATQLGPRVQEVGSPVVIERRPEKNDKCKC